MVRSFVASLVALDFGLAVFAAFFATIAAMKNVTSARDANIHFTLTMARLQIRLDIDKMTCQQVNSEKANDVLIYRPLSFYFQNKTLTIFS